ncbi:MAG: rRNA maturation RNase YbeY [Desulfitobacteriaceae bacterium]|nr:rRNA maturation RNase YbeY [Desulfitobacteriaceae bacterium]MDD4753347.1 rRNA maturation RNase YbeY [Desulfitobacteriaceae bacterium]
MEILIRNQQSKIPVNPEMEKLLEKVVAGAARQADLSSQPEVSILLVDDEGIRELNASYRGIDQSTDVLSFASREEVEDGPEFVSLEDENILGDVVISLETAQRQANEYGHSLEREIGFLAAHGMLHLLGFDHCGEEERAVMREKEESILERIGLTR